MPTSVEKGPADAGFSVWRRQKEEEGTLNAIFCAALDHVRDRMFCVIGDSLERHKRRMRPYNTFSTYE